MSIEGLSTYPSNGKHGVVGSNFLGTSVTASAVGDEDNDTSSERDTGHGKNKFLGPRSCVLGPRGHLALIRQGPGSVKDSE
jgi:hypothetical protein